MRLPEQYKKASLGENIKNVSLPDLENKADSDLDSLEKRPATNISKAVGVMLILLAVIIAFSTTPFGKQLGINKAIYEIVQMSGIPFALTVLGWLVLVVLAVVLAPLVSGLELILILVIFCLFLAYAAIRFIGHILRGPLGILQDQLLENPTIAKIHSTIASVGTASATVLSGKIYDAVLFILNAALDIVPASVVAFFLFIGAHGLSMLLNSQLGSSVDSEGFFFEYLTAGYVGLWGLFRLGASAKYYRKQIAHAIRIILFPSIQIQLENREAKPISLQEKTEMRRSYGFLSTKITRPQKLTKQNGLVEKSGENDPIHLISSGKFKTKKETQKA